MPQLESVDTIITDPPYGLEFMGKEWDRLDTAHQRKKRGAELSDSVKAKYLKHSVEYQGGADAGSFHFGWAVHALRVLKPGAMLLSFGGTRTFHRLTCALEDAGFEIRDCLMWLYGSGFPKSLDVSITGEVVHKLATMSTEELDKFILDQQAVGKRALYGPVIDVTPETGDKDG